MFVYLFIDLFIYWFPVALYPSFAHSSTTIGLLTCPVVDTICLRSCVDTICIGAPVWTLFVFAFLWWRFIHHLNFSLHTYDLNIQVVCDFIVSINYCVSRGGGDYYFTIKLLLFSDLETLSSANRDGRFGSKVCQIGPQIWQVRDFFRSDFSTFCLREPKYTEIWSEKVPDPLCGQIWHPFSEHPHFSTDFLLTNSDIV